VLCADDQRLRARLSAERCLTAERGLDQRIGRRAAARRTRAERRDADGRAVLDCERGRNALALAPSIDTFVDLATVMDGLAFAGPRWTDFGGPPLIAVLGATARF